MSLKDYEVINKLGAGSFGVVYKAKHKKSSELCVIKQIQLTKLDTRLKKWSLNQAKLMKEINSPYIVKYHNSFTQNNKLFIVMEYCVKGDLCGFIKSQMGKLINEQTIWKFTIQIMLGLRQLHTKKILHRDIKTLNIFLDESLNVRIGDLGVAKTLSTDFTNTIVGTPYYLSPQMCEQKPYNEKTDVWAFGCLVYELCTGRHPFEAQNQAALALKIVMGKFQDISKVYSQELRWIVHACLAVDVKKRPTISFILQRPGVLQQAKKLNISISSTEATQRQTTKLQPITKQKSQKQIQLSQILSAVQQANKKVQQTVKKGVTLQQKPSELVGNKKQLKPSQEKYNNNSKKQLNQVQRNHQSSLQKRKQIEAGKKAPLPPKNEVKKVIVQGGSKNGYGQVVNNNISSRDKSKQKVKLQNVPPAQIVKNPKPSSVTNQNQLKHITTITTQLKKPIPPVTPSLLRNQQRKSLPVLQTNDHPQRLQLKKQFNSEDQSKLLSEQSSMIKDLDMLDISVKSNKKVETLDDRLQKERNVKKTNFISNSIQKQVDDDELLAEFGITPEKKTLLNDSLQVKAKSINWDMQSSFKSNTDNTITQKINSSQIPTPHQNPPTKTMFKQLPTIKTQNQNQKQVTVLQHQDDTIENNNQQQDQDNVPYKSDDQDDDNRNSKGQQNILDDLRDEAAFQQEEDSRYLIENIEAEFASQGKQELQKQLQLYSRRLLENQKRLMQLQNMKNHTQKQYFGHLPKQTFVKLKEQLKLQQNDKEVDRLMRELTKNNVQLGQKIWKIFGFEIQIDSCRRNVENAKQKMKQVKSRIQSGDFF